MLTAVPNYEHAGIASQSRYPTSGGLEPHNFYRISWLKPLLLWLSCDGENRDSIRLSENATNFERRINQSRIPFFTIQFLYFIETEYSKINLIFQFV